MKKQRREDESVDETDSTATRAVPTAEQLALHLRQGATTTTTTTCGNQNEGDIEGKMNSFHKGLLQQCLCDVSENVLRKAFEGYQITDENGRRTATLYEWPLENVQQFLSNLQLLFDVYLEYNNRGKICGRIKEICDSLVRNEHCLVEQIVLLCGFQNRYVNYIAARLLSRFFIVAKKQMNKEWLESVLWFLTAENSDCVKMNFALEVIKWVVEWKDVEECAFDNPQQGFDGAGTSSQAMQEVVGVCGSMVDTESYDTSPIKKSIIDSLKPIWQDLILRILYLISHNDNVQSQTCILTFLSLWESTISIKANLSVNDTKPFYTHLETFVILLHNTSLPPVIWKQLLSLFNEVLCYGSTLALQGVLPDAPCRLAHLVVRYVKDFRLLDNLPYRRNDIFPVNTITGPIPNMQPTQSNTDKTLLQKMVLLVLKSVAVTIKETRSDSSDSSDSSDDTDFNQDMQLIERSIRDVFKKVDVFIKNSIDFHPETPFSKVLVHLFSDQTVDMLEAMVCTLDITVGISYHNTVYPDLLAMLNPAHSFIEFLKIVSHDSRVLLDYLKDNGTCFLLYLFRFIKYVTKNWGKFVHSCYENSGARTNDLHNTMTVLIRLKMEINNSVEKGELKYDIDPVLELLNTCQSLYEGNEYS